MNIDFSKTDRLIEVIEDGCHALTFFTSRVENGLQKTRPNLYESLVEITASNMSEKQKKVNRIKAFAREYNLGNNLAEAAGMLKYEFDEEHILKFFTRVYWQLSGILIFKDNSGSNFADKEGLKKLIEKHTYHEPYIDVIVDVIRKQEPRIEDIEQEFWRNCPDTNKINDFCNIYRERWRGHLKEIDEEYYDDGLRFDETNELHQYFKGLRLCGLLQQSQFHVESRLGGIAREINSLSSRIVELFTSLRNSTKDNSNDSNQSTLSESVETVAVVAQVNQPMVKGSAQGITNDTKKRSGTAIIHQLEPFYNAVKYKFRTDQHLTLFEVLQGGKIEGKLQYNGPASEIAGAFGEMMVNSFISTENYISLHEWLCDNFLSTKDGEPKEIKPKSQQEYLNAKLKPRYPLVAIEKGLVTALTNKKLE